MSNKAKRRIKKRKSVYSVGDLMIIENVPMSPRHQTDDDWRLEIKLTSLMIVKRGREEFHSWHHGLFRQGVLALSDGTDDLMAALGEEAQVTELELLDYRFLQVPDRLWPILMEKVNRFLANTPKNGPQPRHFTVSYKPVEQPHEDMNAEGF